MSEPARSPVSVLREGDRLTLTLSRKGRVDQLVQGGSFFGVGVVFLSLSLFGFSWLSALFLPFGLLFFLVGAGILYRYVLREERLVIDRGAGTIAENGKVKAHIAQIRQVTLRRRGSPGSDYATEWHVSLRADPPSRSVLAATSLTREQAEDLAAEIEELLEI